ncbi:efflux RND transporter periplasmic adaptor subunit [Rheinheimera gaetbuli]
MGVVLATGVAFKLFSSPGHVGTQQRVEAKGLQFKKTRLDKFSDTVNVLGNVIPKTTIYLDVVSGGRVEERFAEQGDYVEKGQPLVRLSNTSLQLSVFSLEAQVTEQLDRFRNTQISMDTNTLSLEQDILNSDRMIIQLQRKIKQIEPLVQKGIIAKDQLTEYLEDLEYYQKRKDLLGERKQKEESVIKVQITQLEKQVEAQKENLQFARKELENLLVRAPVTGRLSEFNIELGQSKREGERLGKVDITDKYKVVSRVDEYYLNQISLDMPVVLKINGEKVESTISKIESRVIESKFIVEAEIPKNFSKGELTVKNGQTIDMEIVLSDSDEEVLMIERGPFYRNTGGHWVFVLNGDGTSASKRSIVLGKINQNYFEVLEGLEVGEMVITSSYNGFDKSEILHLK